MFAAVAATWALLLGLGLMMVGNGLQGSLLGLRAAFENFPTAATGLIMSGYFVGFLLGSVVVPRALKRVGHVRVFAALAALASAAILVHLIRIEPVAWWAMRMVTGFCYAGLYIVAESWLNDRATNETRGQILSVYVAIMVGGVALGQLLLNVADPASFELFILVSILVSLAVVPTLLSAGRAPSFEAPAHVGVRQLYATSPLGVVGCLGLGVAHGIVFGMGAVYGNLIGLTVAEVSVFMGAIFFGGVLLQWPLGHLSDRFDRRRVIAVVTFAAAFTALMALVLSPFSATAVIVCAGLFGGLTFPMYSLVVAHTNDHLEPEQMVAASATLILVQGVGACVGPFAVGVAMSTVGGAAFFSILALVHAAIGGFAVWRMAQRPGVPLDAQRSYVPVASSASPVSAALAPQTLRDQMDSDLARAARM